MYSNIGKKIKTLAGILCILGVVLSGIICFRFLWRADNAYERINRGMYTSDELYQAALDDFKETNMENGIKVLVFGSIISWVGTFCLYGFGELIHTNCMMCEDMKEIKRAVVYVGTNRTHNANEDYSAQNNLPGISRKDLQTIMMKRINGEITDEEFEVMVAPYKNEEKRDLE